jgi:hypothetical protein
MPPSDAIDPDLERLVDRADLDELVRRIDDLCTTRDWESLYRLRTLTRSAITSGRQVWPATTLAEYRLALLAPADWASQVLREDASRFSIGPLTEVIAQNHTWLDLSTQLEPGPQRDFVAYERAIRGEVISDDPSLGPRAILDIPFSMQPWEPAYLAPTYSDVGVDHLCPTDSWSHTWTTLTVDHSVQVDVFDDEHTDDALRRLVEPWTAHSAGQARSVIAEGDEVAALGALGLTNETTADIAPLTSEQAVQWLTWCGASSGVHGRRRGMASGRFSAWWLLAALGGLIEDWDHLHHTGELSLVLGETVQSLVWSRWRRPHHQSYELSLLARDNREGVTVALSAYDDAIVTSTS